ncbi:glycerophosphoryl diester phosphodiesterase membrane domain-containing protein [Curtobacterium sp. 9128]|uniref:glycerophosphoryl diester phosphodiesterase membrane domain-containing protein n=1 Tax=Curtobacterium sp. 9128 TaxID=1793722 RepID=UPI0011A04348|nr:glycerophosphoryl diester phosphodiesterase membrane domain-containing protein [Curtobacterium sp. 9128]
MAGDDWQTPGASTRPGGPDRAPTPPPFPGGSAPLPPPFPGGSTPPPPFPGAPLPRSRPVVPLRPLGLGDVLAGAFAVFGRNPRVLLLWSLLLSGVLGLVSTLASALGRESLQSRMFAAVDGSGSGDSDTILAGSVLLFLVISVAVPFLAWIARGFLVAPVAVDSGQRMLGRRGTFRGLWTLLAGRRLTVLWWMLLQIAGGLVVGGAFALVVAGFVGALAASNSGVGGFVLGIIGMVLGFGVALAFFATRFAFTVPTIALEGRGVFAAAAQSWRLTRGAFWRTFGILLLVQVMFGFAAGIASTPLTVGASLFSGVFDPLGQTGSGSGVSVGAVVTLVLGSLLVIAVQCVTDVLSASITTFLAIDRRIRTEALDQRIASHLETGQPSDPFAPAPQVVRPSWPLGGQGWQQQPPMQPGWPQQPPMQPGWPQQAGWPQQPGWQPQPQPPQQQWGPPRPGGH